MSGWESADYGIKWIATVKPCSLRHTMSSKFRGTFFLASLLAFAAIGWPQSAQSIPTIPIAGHVTDSAFKQLPNVTVTLKVLGSDKGIARVETDQTGAFRFPAVPSGAHELHFEKAGFMPVTVPIQVSLEERSIDVGSVIMQIGRVTEGPMVQPLTRIYRKRFTGRPNPAFRRKGTCPIE